MLFWAKKMQQHSFVVVYDLTKRRSKWRRKRRRWNSSSWLNKCRQTSTIIFGYKICKGTILFYSSRRGVTYPSTAIFTNDVQYLYQTSHHTSYSILNTVGPNPSASSKRRPLRYGSTNKNDKGRVVIRTISVFKVLGIFAQSFFINGIPDNVYCVFWYCYYPGGRY